MNETRRQDYETLQVITDIILFFHADAVVAPFEQGPRCRLENVHIKCSAYTYSLRVCRPSVFLGSDRSAPEGPRRPGLRSKPPIFILK